MGICHSKKKVKKIPNHQVPEKNEAEKNIPMNTKLTDQIPKEEPIKKKNEETDNALENVNEIADENIHNDKLNNLKREFLPNQIYTQHLSAIIKSLQDKDSNGEYGQTEPSQTNDGLCMVETYGHYP